MFYLISACFKWPKINFNSFSFSK